MSPPKPRVLRAGILCHQVRAYALRSFAFFKGSVRTGRPVAAWIAFVTAGDAPVSSLIAEEADYGRRSRPSSDLRAVVQADARRPSGGLSALGCSTALVAARPDPATLR
jgi:hypothetical protein